MSRPYFLRIAYDGTAYRGWQRQADNLPTVQQTIEELLSRVHHREVTVGGCGRTDAGVHASQYYLHLQTEEPLPANYQFFVNKQLPGDIRLLEIIPVTDKAQARYDATERTYDYFFHAHPDAFLDRFSSRLDLTDFAPADSAQMLPALLQHTDFRAFCKTPDRHNTTLVHFTEASLWHNAGRFRFRFRANRFLRGMIRLLVQDLIHLGRKEIAPESFREMLETRERPPHFQLAPPQGLFLTGVTYPYLERPPDLPVTGRIDWYKIPMTK
ncbi:MAG: tRNA pseudouridine(38-40) synthase TruA [Bacteroidota bacterium]